MSPETVVQLEAVAFALGCAALLSLAAVLQHRAAGRVATHKSMRPALLIELVRRPMWVVGVLCDVAAYVFQFLALRRGSILLVQSVLVTGLLFAIPLGAALSHRRPSQSDFVGTVGVVGGLIVFLATADPSLGRDDPGGPMGYAVLMALFVAVVGALLLLAPREPGRRRAMHLGAACGVTFGFNAALTKASGEILERDGLGLLLAWQVWVLAGTAAFGFLLVQSAFQAGPLESSLPVLTISDPLASAAIGLIFLQEHISTGPVEVVLEICGFTAMVAGVFILARSPLIAATACDADDHTPPVEQRVTPGLDD
ncbi:MAG: DMT family transporter [Acidimicrobiales bacterium]